jgi:putative proteasome-type protease
MTYCVGIKLDAGLVFLSDSRTNAGLDQISTYRKMMVYEKPGDRFMVMLSAGNLSISQSVREILQVEKIDNGDAAPTTIWNANSMFDAVRVLGSAVRRVYDQDGKSLKASGIDFNASMIFGGQIKGEAMRLFLVYSAGNFIEATRETCYFQVGESKYGKPVLDRMITPATPLDEASKCALVSMDSTLKSNLSVGLPLDLLVYANNDLRSDQVVCIDEHNPYFQMIRGTWGQKLRQVFESIDDPHWTGAAGASNSSAAAAFPLCVPSARYEPMRKITHPGEKIV